MKLNFKLKNIVKFFLNTRIITPDDIYQGQLTLSFEILY